MELFIELVHNVAKFLGWQVDEVVVGAAHITDGLHRLVLRVNSITKISKVDITGILGEPLSRFVSDPELRRHTIHIQCSTNRGAEAIAKDIKNRLLPDYLRLWEMASQEKQRSEEEEARLRFMSESLARIIGTYPHPSYKDGTKIRAHPTLKTGGASGDINLDLDVSQSYGNIDIVNVNMTIPYALCEEFMEWISTKTESCFETWHKKSVAEILRSLNKEAKSANQPRITHLPPNNFSWKEAYRRWWQGDNGRYFSFSQLLEAFKMSIIDRPDTIIEETIEQKIDRLSRPFDNAALLRAYKEIGYESAYQKQEDLKYLIRQSEDLSDWINTVMNWGLCEDHPKVWEDMERREFISELIKKLQPVEELKSTEPQPVTVVQPVEELKSTEPQPVTVVQPVEELKSTEPQPVTVVQPVTVEELKSEYGSLKAAKLALQIKAASWAALAEKFNAKSNKPEPKSSASIERVVSQLKAKYGKLAIAKAALQLKAASWAALAEKFNASAAH